MSLTSKALNWTEPAIDIAQPIFLLLQLGGQSEPELHVALERIFADIMEVAPEATGIVASSVAQERMLWRLREDTDIIYRAYPAAPSFDVSVPLSRVETYVARISSELAQLDADLAPFLFGHLADGNLHIVFNHAGPFAETVAVAVEDVLYRDLRAMGGSFSAEHGVGSKRIHALNATTNTVKLSVMADVKRLLDPDGLFNPGKIFSDH